MKKSTFILLFLCTCFYNKSNAQCILGSQGAQITQNELMVSVSAPTSGGIGIYCNSPANQATICEYIF